MKKLKIFGCLLFLGFFLLAGLGCEQSGAAGSASLRGAISKSGGGGEFVLTASGKTYVLESQQDLTEMVGKSVKLTGTVSEKDGRSTFVVSSVSQ
jgi:hypothetical protein